MESAGVCTRNTVAMVCQEGNYDLKLDFTPEQQALIDGLNDGALYDITFTATKSFSAAFTSGRE